MPEKKNVLLILASFLLLVGCGVSQDEFDKKVSELEAAKQKNEKLEQTIREKDSKISELGGNRFYKIILDRIYQIFRVFFQLVFRVTKIGLDSRYPPVLLLISRR